MAVYHITRLIVSDITLVGKCTVNLPQSVLQEKIQRVKKELDLKVMSHSEKYMPVLLGGMRDSMYAHTIIGSGKIIQGGADAPQTRYLYYGEVYGPNIPIKRNGIVVGFYSPKGQKKHPTGRPITYHNGGALRGSHWFERMAQAEATDIAREVTEEINK